MYQEQPNETRARQLMRRGVAEGRFHVLIEKEMQNFALTEEEREFIKNYKT